MQEVKDRALFPIQKAEPQYIPVKVIKERTEVQRHSQPRPLHPQRTLIRIAGKRGSDRVPSQPFTPLVLFGCESDGIPIVLVGPERNVILFPICFDDIVLQPGYGAWYMKVMIDKIVFVDDRTAGPK